jgi:UDP-3-O-[3-hydroxymyristoyl] glucosamine N-acyltransferase
MATASVEIGQNSFVQEYVVLQPGARVSDNVFLDSGTSVGYCSVIEADCFTGAHVTVGHSCKIGRDSFLGAGCWVVDGRSVAEDCTIGIGAIVLKDTTVGRMYLGNPARPLPHNSFETSGLTST